MNNFEPQYIILSSKYLQEKIDFIKSKQCQKQESQEKEKSKLQKIVSDFFK